MNVKEENICRLCLNVVENDFEIIDESTSRMFKVLLLSVNLDISQDPIICKDCAKVMEKCFNFKSACIDTEKLIFSFARNKDRATFDLKDLYKNGQNLETVDNFICRFCCNHLSRSNFILLETLMNDITFVKMLQVFMPEMNFRITKNPVICTPCRQDLECYNKFANDCLDVEEKITKYIQNKGTASAQVKLSEIPRCLFKNISEIIKQEKDALEDTAYETHSEIYNIGPKELLDIKNEVVCFNETARETPSDIPIEIYVIKQEKDGLESKGKASSEVYDIKSEDPLDIKDEESCFNASVTPSQKPMDKLNIPCELNINMSEKAWKASTANKSLISIKAKYVYDMKQESETEINKAYQMKYKGEGNKKKNHMLRTKNISKERNFKCENCNYQSKHKKLLNSHSLIHKDITEVVMYKCSMCTYQAKQKRLLKSHVLIHRDITKVDMYECSMCTYQARQKSNLRAHMLIHKGKSEVKLYQCSMCSYQAKHRGNLSIHMLIHKDSSEVRMFKCSMCTYQAKHKGNLKIHMLIHKDKTEVEMFKCSMCTYEAKQKGSLKIHMLIHKEKTEVEIYKCSMCTYQAKRKTNLKAHMLTHKNFTEVEMYKCLKCPYQAKQKSHLKTHMLIHKDKKEVETYKCTMCTHETKHKRNLKIHMLIHKDITEVEMYKCLVCTYQAKHKSSLKRHNMLIHKDIRM